MVQVLCFVVSPNFAVDELQHVEHVYPLGSEQEYMLYNLLYYSINNVLPDANWKVKGKNGGLQIPTYL